MKRGVDKISKKLDQYFTKSEIALKCVELVQEQLNIKIYEFNSILEPSYGDGAFVDVLKSKNILETKLFYIDIDSKDKEHKADFLSTELKLSSPILTIGNPPFGKNSSLAIDFFNKSATFSDVIAFILPRTFRKNSCVNRLDRNFFLVFEYVLNPYSFTFEGTDYDVPCVFQIWSNVSFISNFKSKIDIPVDKIRIIPKKLKKTSDFEFVKNSNNPDIAIRRVGVNAGKIFTDDIESRSKESHLFIKILEKEKFNFVLNKLKEIGLETIDSKYDTAGNPSISKDEICRFYSK